MLIFLFMACTDPDFGHLGASLEAYERGVLAMEQGDATMAVESFTEAIAHDPTRPSLRSWEARAYMKAGLPDRAVASLNRGLERFPDDAAMRYQRAAIFVKKGNIEGAVQDLRWLYANEKVHPVEVGEDPDFLALRVDPLYADLVPASYVQASVHSQQSSVLVGDVYTVEFTITSRTGSPISLRNQGETLDVFALRRVVEDVVERGDVWTKRNLLVEFKALSAGQIAVGPWFVQSGKDGSLTERLVVDIVGIPGREVSTDDNTMSMVVPSSRWGREPTADFTEQSDGLWAVMGAEMVVAPVQARLGPRMEYRESGQPRWSVEMVDPAQESSLRSGGAQVKRWPKKPPSN